MQPVRLPGAEIVEPGLADLRNGQLTEDALAVLAVATRLRPVGVDVPTGFDEIGASVALYERLAARLGDGAHARHHALIARLLSYATSARATTRHR